MFSTYYKSRVKKSNDIVINGDVHGLVANKNNCADNTGNSLFRDELSVKTQALLSFYSEKFYDQSIMLSSEMKGWS